MIAENIQRVQRRIAEACQASARPLDAVRLLAVSKTFGPESVRQAHAAGLTAFGENYLQEGVEKIKALADLPLEWHCIGPVQSNKTRLVAEHFDWMHTVDRLKTAQRLSEQRPQGMAPPSILTWMHTCSGATKAGVAPEAALELALHIQALPRLRLRGLMTIPEPTSDFAAACAVHAKARALLEALNAQGLALDTLSMGMTADLEAAVQAGSTLVRVGSAIFGSR